MTNTYSYIGEGLSRRTHGYMFNGLYSTCSGFIGDIEYENIDSSIFFNVKLPNIDYELFYQENRYNYSPIAFDVEYRSTGPLLASDGLTSLKYCTFSNGIYGSFPINIFASCAIMKVAVDNSETDNKELNYIHSYSFLNNEKNVVFPVDIFYSYYSSINSTPIRLEEFPNSTIFRDVSDIVSVGCSDEILIKNNTNVQLDNSGDVSSIRISANIESIKTVLENLQVPPVDGEIYRIVIFPIIMTHSSILNRQKVLYPNMWDKLDSIDTIVVEPPKNMTRSSLRSMIRLESSGKILLEAIPGGSYSCLVELEIGRNPVILRANDGQSFYQINDELQDFSESYSGNIDNRYIELLVYNISKSFINKIKENGYREISITFFYSDNNRAKRE